MKHFTTLLLPFFVLGIGLLSSQKASASHAVGGEVIYEYIGDSTGVPFHYRIYLKLYRRTAGIGFGTNETVSISSSCYGSQNITVTAVGAQNTPLINFDECTDSAFAATPVSLYYYSAVITLPGTCSDFKFSYSICCRNPDVDNLVSPSGENIYLESTLNNTFGPNSSPVILSEGSKAFCIGQKVNWSQNASEEDGDSLYYELIQPLGGPNQPIAWSPGYSTLQPITTTNGAFLDHQNGDFIFTPAQTETDMVRVRISEYRYDTTFATFLKIAHIDRDVQIYILASCPATPSKIVIGSSADSLALDTINISCGTKRLTINFSSRIDCQSIAPDGTDFALFNSQHNLIPIIAAGSDSCRGNATRSLWLEFNDSISYNDSVYLVSRTGSDFNTIESICGPALPERDSVFMVITSCSTGIGQMEINIPEIKLYPNPVNQALNLELPGIGKTPYSIFNTEGIKVEEGLILEQNTTIDVSHLASGLYILRIPLGENMQILKFQKL